MNKFYVHVLLILFISCNNSNSSIVSDDFIGVWLQNEALYKKEVKENHMAKHMGNLSDAFGEIKMIINADSTYQSHFDNQINNGKWKIEDDVLYMTPHDNHKQWIPFKYKLNKGELFIYSDPWLMALSRK